MDAKKRKIILLALGIPFGIILLCTLIFLLYTAFFYRADAQALSILENSEYVEKHEGYVVLYPETQSDTALVFYPGGKVEFTAYLPLLELLRQAGITCVLVDMPLNYAIFNTDAALDIFLQFPEIQHWYIGGHSLGGISAGIFAEQHPETIEGLVVLGSYVYGDYPPKQALTVYGTLNANLEESIDYTENIVVIEGANHAQFGNYGKQRGDTDATITAAEQQAVTAQAIVEFVGL